MGDENAGYQKSEKGMPLALEGRAGQSDGRLFSPSTGRNKDSVRSVFLDLMPARGHILEIASGTGEHGAHITQVATELHWAYSDIDETSLQSQAAWREAAPHNRLSGPYHIDTTQPDWGEAEHVWDGLFCANMIHIAPFAAAEGLFAGAGRLLPPGGLFFLYGPFARAGEMAPSNARFSQDLKRRDPAWGVRDLDLDLLPLAQANGLTLKTVAQMPANNLSVVFQKTEVTP